MSANQELLINCMTDDLKTLEIADNTEDEDEDDVDPDERDIHIIIQCGRKLGVEISPEICDYALELLRPDEELSLDEVTHLIIEHAEGVPLEAMSLEEYTKMMPRPCDTCNKVKDEMEHFFNSGLMWICEDCRHGESEDDN